MSDLSRNAALAATYTPGTTTDTATQNGSTGPYPASTNLGMATPAIAPHVPIVGVALILAVLFLLEHRRIRLSRR